MRIKGFGLGSMFGGEEFVPSTMCSMSAMGMLDGTGDEGAGAGGGGGGDGGAGAGAGGGGEQQQQQQQGGGDPWYATGLSTDDDKTWLQNKGYASLEDTIKAHRSLETKLGAGRFNVPSDWNDEAQAKAAYKALGLPDEIGDAYKLELPEGADPAFSTAFAEKAHAAGVLPHQFKALGAAYMEAEAAAVSAQAEAFKTQSAADIDGLKSSAGWGANFEANDAIAGAAAKALGIDVPALAKSQGTKRAMEILYDLGKRIGEDGIEGGGGRPIGGNMNGAQAAEAKKTFLADASKTEKLRAKDPATVAEWQRINGAIAAELDRAGSD